MVKSIGVGKWKVEHELASEKFNKCWQVRKSNQVKVD